MRSGANSRFVLCFSGYLMIRVRIVGEINKSGNCGMAPKLPKIKPLRASSGGEMRDHLQQALPQFQQRALQRIESKRGRPSTYSEERAESIFSLMAEGVSLTNALDMLEIPRSTLWRWEEKGDFADRLARAREAYAEHAASEAIAIPLRLLEECEAHKEDKIDPARVQAAKLASDTWRWYAERLKTRTFGDKTKRVEISGPNGSPIQMATVTIDAASLSDEQREILRIALRSARTGSDDLASNSEEAE